MLCRYVVILVRGGCVLAVATVYYDISTEKELHLLVPKIFATEIHSTVAFYILAITVCTTNTEKAFKCSIKF